MNGLCGARFNNSQAVLEALGTVEKEAEIVIDDYKMIYIPSDVTNTATFVRSVSRQSKLTP